jgi:hypothetical protein
MPELRSLSTGTFFGTFEEGWTTGFGGIRSYMPRVGDIQKVYSQMLLSGKVTHFCQSGNLSPLSIHPRELESFRPPSPASGPASNLPVTPTIRTITIHVDLKAYKSAAVYETLCSSSSCLPGVNVRWCFDNPRRTRSDGNKIPFLDFDDQPLFAKSIFLAVVGGLSARHDKRDAHPQPADFPLLPFTIDAFIPVNDATATMLLQGDKVTNPRGASAKEKTANKRRAAAQKLEDAMGTELFKTDVEKKVLHADDRLGIRYIADCPACPARGWLPVE